MMIASTRAVNEDDIETKAWEVRDAIKQAQRAIVDGLPPEYRSAHVARRRHDDRERQRRSRQHKEAKLSFMRTVCDRIMSGHTQAQIAESLGVSPARVSEATSQFWPLPKPAYNDRYVVVRVSRRLLAELDHLAEDMDVSRSSALEHITTVALEDGASVARKIMKTRGQ